MAERSRSATREGKPYFVCRFREGRRLASTMIWADSPWYEACAGAWQEGRAYKIRGTYQESERFGSQIDIQNIRPVQTEDAQDGFDIQTLIDTSRLDPELLWAELQELVANEIADPPLRKLVQTLLERHASSLKILPATQNKFHPFAGGLLEHIVSVTKSCLLLADRYIPYYAELKPPLNRELLVAAAILHDIGRVVEFQPDLLTAKPTVEGKLFGHLLLGRDLVRDAAREQGDVNPEVATLLEHIIITHLTLPEWGSPRLPLIPECLILHHADDLDAKLEMYVRCLIHDHAIGPFTDRDPVLGKQLYKGRSV